MYFTGVESREFLSCQNISIKEMPRYAPANFSELFNGSINTIAQKILDLGLLENCSLH